MGALRFDCIYLGDLYVYLRAALHRDPLPTSCSGKDKNNERLGVGQGQFWQQGHLGSRPHFITDLDREPVCDTSVLCAVGFSPVKRSDWSVGFLGSLPASLDF